MICPTLRDLPLAPAGKTGWPWTEETPPSQDTMLKNLELPKISIVTPSYNQGQFLEETIRSVLLQGYPDLEYIIIDGGSTDDSVDIIRRYEPWLAYWVSEPDRGQSHAINKGWERTIGEIIAYLNSDDTYETGAIEKVARFFVRHPEIDMVYGDCFLIDVNSKKIGPMWGQPSFLSIEKMIKDHRYYVPQPAMFIRMKVLEKVGLLDEYLHFKMDRDIFIRIGLHSKIANMNEFLAHFRLHKQAKTNYRNSLKMRKEFCLIRKRYGGHFSFIIGYYFLKQLMKDSIRYVFSKVPLLDKTIMYLLSNSQHR